MQFPNSPSLRNHKVMQVNSLDIFCNVIDNFGDAGFVYRFAREFRKTHPLCRIRVFIDDLATLKSIVPALNADTPCQDYDGITYIQSQILTPKLVETLGVPDVLIEAFGCIIPDCVLNVAALHTKLHINLEYLSAESWVDNYHLKISLNGYPVMKKFFYMPGFTANTGGILIDTHIEHNRTKLLHQRYDYLARIIAPYNCTFTSPDTCLFGSVFTYTRNFDALLQGCTGTGKDVYLLFFGEKSKTGMQQSALFGNAQQLSPDYFCYNRTHILFMPFLPQQQYDELLCTMDFNVVRGEDSLVRAILAHKPFIWNAYLQDNKYQQVKVSALLTVFASFCPDKTCYEHYCRLMTDFNDNEYENASKTTGETYDWFFRHLACLEICTAEWGRSMVNNNNLIQKISAFLADY